MGTCDLTEVDALSQALALDWERDWHCLMSGSGLCGLPNWASETINAIGNLIERNYTVDDVAEALKRLAGVAPSLAVKVHCGGDWESLDCVATVTLVDNEVTVGSPEMLKIPKIPEAQMLGHFFQAITRRGR